MSEYVEARYAKLVLLRARLADQQAACQLINDLLRDLSSLQRLDDAGARSVTSIRMLARSLDRRRSLQVPEWDDANRAVEAWCQGAFK